MDAQLDPKLDPKIAQPIATPLVSNGSGVAYETALPVIDPLIVEQRAERIRPRDILPGSFFGSLNDANGDGILDGDGVVSDTQFANSVVTISNAGGSTTSTTNMTVDVPNLTISFTLARSANVLIFAQVGAGLGGAGTINEAVQMRLCADGALIGGYIYLTGQHYHSGGSIFPSYLSSGTMMTISQLVAGAHTLTVRYATTNAANPALGTDLPQVIGYVVLGT